jgi:sec-independent protein translocase protein TatA
MCPVFASLDNPVMLLLLGALAVLLFGERLPEVARSFGRGLMEFRKGMHGIQDEIRSAIDSAVSTDASPRGHDDPYAAGYRDPGTAPHEGPEGREEATSPKFEPPRAS